MKKIAVCGNIASGKSTVEKMIENRGFKVLDTDEVAHNLLTIKNKSLYDGFKDYDVFENGEFSREKIGKLIFYDNSLKNKLESILHPQIRREIQNFFEKNDSEALIFVAIPLLFEAKMQDLFDKIIFVHADDTVRFERLIKRNGYSQEYAKTRIDSQMPQEDKVNLSDYVLYNNGSIPQLEKSVDAILNNL